MSKPTIEPGNNESPASGKGGGSKEELTELSQIIILREKTAKLGEKIEGFKQSQKTNFNVLSAILIIFLFTGAGLIYDMIQENILYNDLDRRLIQIEEKYLEDTEKFFETYSDENSLENKFDRIDERLYNLEQQTQ